MSSEQPPISPEQLRVSAPRLAAVQASGLLDTEAEEAFDALSRLAATLLESPASFLAIVDKDRDFYKSQVGFPDALARSRELSGRTFCHYALATTTPLVINDTLADDTWKDIPTVASLGVRAYMGVPLRVGGQPIGSLCVIDQRPREWTARDRETLAQLSRSAEREIALRMALKKAEIALERANGLAVARETLLATVAHDLRTPLQVVGMSAAVLTGMPDLAASAHVQRISTAAALMRRLVNDLVAADAVDRHANQRTTVEVARLFADAMRVTELVAEHAGLRISIGSSEGTVSVDQAEMLRVFANLIGNCIKYCPAGSTVALTALDRDDCVELRVADDGPGMTEDERTRAFDRGWQGAQGVAQHGAGLGLTIVRELVLRNDGLVTIDSEPGKGTTVLLRLPRAA